MFGLANICLAKGQAPHENINRRFRVKIILTCFKKTLSLVKYRMKAIVSRSSEDKRIMIYDNSNSCTFKPIYKIKIKTPYSFISVDKMHITNCRFKKLNVI